MRIANVINAGSIHFDCVIAWSLPRLLSIIFITMFFISFVVLCVCFCSANKLFANSFLFIAHSLVRVGVTRNTRQIFARASRRRVWTETFADSGRYKSKTPFHHVPRGARLLGPRSCRKRDLWS